MLQQLVYNQPVPCPTLQLLASESHPCPLHCKSPRHAPLTQSFSPVNRYVFNWLFIYRFWQYHFHLSFLPSVLHAQPISLPVPVVFHPNHMPYRPSADGNHNASCYDILTSDFWCQIFYNSDCLLCLLVVKEWSLFASNPDSTMQANLTPLASDFASPCKLV